MDQQLAIIEKSRRLHKTYFKELERFYRFAIPEGSSVLEVGCGTGRLLSALKPSRGLGIDPDNKRIEVARDLNIGNKKLSFEIESVDSMDWQDIEPFEYIVISDLIPVLKDVQKSLKILHQVCKPSSRIILNFHNNLWQPLLRAASMFGIRRKSEQENWLSMADLKNILYLAGFQSITSGTRVLLPLQIPVITSFCNRFLAKIPIIQHLCLTCVMLARPEPESIKRSEKNPPSVSILIPTRNERGNIEDIFTRTPQMGKWTELIFVDGSSTDGTVEAIQAGIKQFGKNWHRCLFLPQSGTGKGQAVRQGFDECKGDILMILDSDLTMPPEDLPKYFHAISSNKGEFINGCRLVYPMESKAMRFLNMIANKIFAILFTWLLEQPVKDTLCGTKVLRREEYETIARNRSYFGDFDPFGDFDLLFGASKLNLKIVDMPIRYRDRTYGDIKISRWTHGVLLLKMCVVAFKKLKLS
ncbi:glycosyltransferase [bacterium]|nr:glycosyltransferase [bacterium]